MSTWDLIERVLTQQPIGVPLVRRELYVVKEAMASITKRSLRESSAWDYLERVGLIMEAEPPKVAVKGLTDKEVAAIRMHPKASQMPTKTGNTGEIMMLDPKSWQQIRQELEANKDYYDMVMGGVGGVDSAIKKIGDQLSLHMGTKPATAPKPPQPGLPGQAKDVTPSVQGPEQFQVMQPQKPLGQTGGGSPFASKAPAAVAPAQPAVDPEAEKKARRARVAAQDAALMGGKTKPVGKVKVQGESAYECEEGEEQ